MCNGLNSGVLLDFGVYGVYNYFWLKVVFYQCFDLVEDFGFYIGVRCYV